MLVVEKAGQFQEHMGLEFANDYFLQHALVHRSAMNGKIRPDIDLYLKEKLQMMGEKLFHLVTAELTFQHVVSDSVTFNFYLQEVHRRKLAALVADDLALSSFLVASKGFDWNASKKDPILYGVLAAIYLEHRYEGVLQVVTPAFFRMLEDIMENRSYDYVHALKEWAGKRNGKLEVVENGTELREESGQLMHKAVVQLLGKQGKGKGTTFDMAVQRAAKDYFARYIKEAEWQLPLKNLRPTAYGIPRRSVPERRSVEALKRIPFFKLTRAILLHQSLTHVSYYNNNPEPEPLDSTPLTTLGSFAQAFLYAHYLFWNDEALGIDELQHGLLLQSYLCGTEANSRLFDQLQLNAHLWRGRTVKSVSAGMKADTVKALFGAHYLSKRDYNANPHDMLRILLHQHIPAAARDFNPDERNASTVLQEVVQLLGPGWQVTFENKVLANVPGSTAVEVTVTVLHDGTPVLQRVGTGPTHKQGATLLSQQLLRELRADFHLQTNERFNEQYRSMLTALLDRAIHPRRLSEKKYQEALRLCGGFGLAGLSANAFRNAYDEMKLTIRGLRCFGVADAERYYRDLLAASGYFQEQKYSLFNIQPYVDSLIEWVEGLSLESSTAELEPFIKNIADTLQVFRMVTELPFDYMPLAPIFDDIKLIMPRSIELRVIVKGDAEPVCFGQRSFLNGFFFAIVSQLQDHLDGVEQLEVELHVQRQSDNDDTLVELYFAPERVREDFYRDLTYTTQFAAFSFMEVEVDAGVVRISCLYAPEQGTGSAVDIDADTSRLMRWIHEKHVEAVVELSPLGGLMHDLKNALTVTMRTLALHKRKGVSDPDKLKSLGDACLSKAGQLHAFLRFTKPRRQRVDLEILTERLRSDMLMLAGGSHTVTVETELVTPIVVTDADMLYSVVANLGKNAIESFGAAGQLRIGIRCGDELLAITVSDNGSGIPEEKQQTLFTSFYTTKAGANGSGLGLPTVKRIVDLLKGEISFDSRLGVGTTFDILIPVKEAKPM
jgi:signal transduction histidine kinase/dsRNA-specific ribonuclease